MARGRNPRSITERSSNPKLGVACVCEARPSGRNLVQCVSKAVCPESAKFPRSAPCGLSLIAAVRFRHKRKATCSRSHCASRNRNAWGETPTPGTSRKRVGRRGGSCRLREGSRRAFVLSPARLREGLGVGPSTWPQAPPFRAQCRVPGTRYRLQRRAQVRSCRGIAWATLHAPARRRAEAHPASFGAGGR